MTLEILIPTYNRASFLKKNLEGLSKIVSDLSLQNEVSIFVSDNASPDETSSVVCDMKDKGEVCIRYHKQDKNQGFLKNVDFLISNTHSDFIMLLGDDDFISKEYLKRVVELLQSDTSITGIIPAFKEIDVNGQIIVGSGRDIGLSERKFSSGYNNLLMNSFRAHQVSGIIIKAGHIIDIYKSVILSNAYPQIFLLGEACLEGNVYHVPQFPIMVTRTNRKFWNYDNTGLLVDIYENYAKLNLTQIQRYKCEVLMMKRQPFRVMSSPYNPFKTFWNAIVLSWNNNTSWPGHFLHPLNYMSIYLKNIMSVWIYKSRLLFQNVIK